MNKSEFINWLENKSDLERKFIGDNEWRRLIDYAEYIWDELYIEEDHVVFSWEEWRLGSKDYHREEYSFEDFIELYESDSLKND